jgi:glycosyltransferase involved in cell wall biosynthesis
VIPIEISVVIPSLNAAETIGEQLEALAGQDLDQPWEVIVVDNGSVDKTASIAAAWRVHPRADLRVVSEPRRGLNVARNAGVRAAVGARIAICDADDIVSPSWVRLLTGALDVADIAAGSLTVKSVNSEAVTAMRGWTRRDEPILTVGRELGYLDQILCGDVAFRREVWDRMGGFDEQFDDGGDDVDFGWRAQLAGFRVVSVPEASIEYRARGDVRALFRQYVRDGRGSAHLYQRFRSSGMPPRGAKQVLATLAWIVRRLPKLMLGDDAERGHLVRVAGKQWGRVLGSIQRRVVYL